MTAIDLAVARQRMVEHDLQGRGIADCRVLEVMARVPRERFVRADSLPAAYADRALPIDCQQTISQPYIVALMSEALGLRGGEKVLEIGTGSGYQTAVLAELCRQVVSIERHEALSQQARRVLTELGYGNVSLRVGDGTLGWPAEAPYQGILVAAAAARVPPALVEQLAEGGVLVMPVGHPDHQVLQAIHKTSGAAVAVPLSACRFVPLVSQQGCRG